MKEAIIFGAGNIGRGFIGQLFSELGYFVTFVDIDQPLLDAINQRSSYTIRLATNARVEDITVGPVRGLHTSQVAEIAEAISQAEIGATAVGVPRPADGRSPRRCRGLPPLRGREGCPAQPDHL